MTERGRELVVQAVNDNEPQGRNAIMPARRSVATQPTCVNDSNIPSTDPLHYRGVAVSSRWSTPHEYETMKRIVDSLPATARARTESIWCDSNAGACYSVRIGEGAWTTELADLVHDGVIAVNGGFNSLSIESGSQSSFFDAFWEGDEEWM